jgi:AcrR family transcriptional regulator
MGFHQTSMQQICSEAGMSAGNVYRYFPSKEAIIEGITEFNEVRDFLYAKMRGAREDHEPHTTEASTTAQPRKAVVRARRDPALP